MRSRIKSKKTSLKKKGGFIPSIISRFKYPTWHRSLKNIYQCNNKKCKKKTWKGNLRPNQYLFEYQCKKACDPQNYTSYANHVVNFGSDVYDVGKSGLIGTTKFLSRPAKLIFHKKKQKGGSSQIQHFNTIQIQNLNAKIMEQTRIIDKARLEVHNIEQNIIPNINIQITILEENGLNTSNIERADTHEAYIYIQLINRINDEKKNATLYKNIIKQASLIKKSFEEDIFKIKFGPIVNRKFELALIDNGIDPLSVEILKNNKLCNIKIYGKNIGYIVSLGIKGKNAIIVKNTADAIFSS